MHGTRRSAAPSRSTDASSGDQKQRGYSINGWAACDCAGYVPVYPDLLGLGKNSVNCICGHGMYTHELPTTLDDNEVLLCLDGQIVPQTYPQIRTKEQQ